MTDINGIFQTASLSQQKNVLTTVTIGEGYLPSSLTASLAFPSMGSTFNFNLLLDSPETIQPPVSVQTQVSSTLTISNSQKDILLGTTESLSLIGGDIVIGVGLETAFGKKNKPEPSW